jgi:sugar lactone lactonase YvrE
MRITLIFCTLAFSLIASAEIRVVKDRELPVAKGGPALGKRDPKLQCVAQFEGARPAGVAVTHDGRIFLTFPRWSNVPASCVELIGDQLKPVPNLETYQRGGEIKFDSIQGIVVDEQERLWMLDAGSARLYALQLSTNLITQQIRFTPEVLKTSTYANDLRIDSKRGKPGFAYISDSAGGGVIVVDLASGESWRRLQHAPSARSDPNFTATVEGQPYLSKGNCDGIALGPDGKHLYYTAFSRREIHRVDCDALCDRAKSDQEVEATIKRIATKTSGNDGILCDAEGRIYTTDYEESAIRRWSPDAGPDQKGEIIVQDERLLWPDALWIHEGQLYITCNQLNRTKPEMPYTLFRIPVDAHAIDQP